MPGREPNRYGLVGFETSNRADPGILRATPGWIMNPTIAKTAELSVTIDEPIQSSPELFEAVRSAQRYFESHYLDEPTEEDSTRTAEMRWESATDGTLVKVELEERDRLGHRVLDTRLTLKQMADDVTRDVAMIRLWRAVLRKRSTVRMRKLNRMITELEQSEAVGAN